MIGIFLTLQQCVWYLTAKDRAENQHRIKIVRAQSLKLPPPVIAWKQCKINDVAQGYRENVVVRVFCI